jgi:hypothetical protein
MSEDLTRDSVVRRLVNKIKIKKPSNGNQVLTGGHLGVEGEGFISPKKTILNDVEQAMFIRKFIIKSLDMIESQFKENPNQMLVDFCNDENIFRELEQSNQLDIKGKLMRFLEQFFERISIFS